MCSSDLVSGDSVAAGTLLDELGPFDGLASLVSALEPGMEPSPGLVAACVEFAIEGLWLTRRIDKDRVGGVSRYGSS